MKALPRRTYPAFVALVLVPLATACERAVELEVRTFAVEHLPPDETMFLLSPYVYENRQGAPGVYSVSDGAVTVRETQDNLEQIARVLAEYDVPRPDMRLTFQLIEADGFGETDPRIADVTDELRSVLQFAGYRLVGEGIVSVTDGSAFSQTMRGEGGPYEIFAEVSRMTPTTIRLEHVTLAGASGDPIQQTTVNVQPGQTLVLGSSPGLGDSGALLLTVRADLQP